MEGISLILLLILRATCAHFEVALYIEEEANSNACVAMLENIPSLVSSGALMKGSYRIMSRSTTLESASEEGLSNDCCSPVWTKVQPW